MIHNQISDHRCFSLDRYSIQLRTGCRPFDYNVAGKLGNSNLLANKVLQSFTVYLRKHLFLFHLFSENSEEGRAQVPQHHAVHTHLTPGTVGQVLSRPLLKCTIPAGEENPQFGPRQAGNCGEDNQNCQTSEQVRFYF